MQIGRLLVTDSEDSRIEEMGNKLLDKYGSYAQSQVNSTHVNCQQVLQSCAQGFTQIAGEHIEMAMTLGSNDTVHSALKDKLSSWTQLQVIPHKTYFENFDQESASYFVVFVFGSILHLYLNSLGVTALVNSRKELQSAESPEKMEECASEARVQTNDARTLYELSPAEVLQNREVLPSKTESRAREGFAHDPELAASPRMQVIQDVMNADQATTHDPYQLLADPNDHTTTVSKRQDVLCHATRDRLATLVHTMGGDTVELKGKLQNKAQEYYQLHQKGYDLYLFALIEAKSGAESFVIMLFHIVSHTAVRVWTKYLLILFLLVLEFVEDKVTRCVSDACCLVAYTMITSAVGFLQLRGFGWLRASTIFELILLMVMFGLLVANVVADVEALGVLRPVLLITASHKVLLALTVLWKAVVDAKAIVFMFFTIIALTGIMGNTLFQGEFDKHEGGTLDDFVTSFISM